MGEQFILFEAFLERANRVIKDVNDVQDEEKKRGLVKWAPCVGICRRMTEFLDLNYDGDSFQDFIGCPLWKKSLN